MVMPIFATLFTGADSSTEKENRTTASEPDFRRTSCSSVEENASHEGSFVPVILTPARAVEEVLANGRICF